MPFGLTNTPTTFQRLMSSAFKEFWIFLDIFMDDLYVHFVEIEEHNTHLKKVFEKCQVYRIYLNPDKCKFMVRQGKILGHIVLRNGISTNEDKIVVIVSRNGISTNEDKIVVIVELPRLLSAKGVHIFMGHYEYYHRFMYMYTKISKPLYILLVVYKWMEDCEEDFGNLKQVLVFAPILQAPNWNKIFHVHIEFS